MPAAGSSENLVDLLEMTGGMLSVQQDAKRSKGGAGGRGRGRGGGGGGQRRRCVLLHVADSEVGRALSRDAESGTFFKPLVESRVA